MGCTMPCVLRLAARSSSSASSKWRRGWWRLATREPTGTSRLLVSSGASWLMRDV